MVPAARPCPAVRALSTVEAVPSGPSERNSSMTEILEPLPPVWRIALPHDPVAVPMARALVRTALHDLRAAADGDAAELLTAELVTHAVEHTQGTGPIHLVVERVT